MNDRPAREERTSFTEACYVSDGLASAWELFGLESHYAFFDFIFKEMWDCESTSGDGKYKVLKETENLTEWDGKPITSKVKSALIQIAIIEVACAFAIQSLKTKKNSKLAWSYACEANLWLGLLKGTMTGYAQAPDDSSKFAKAGAAARHAENHQMKAEIIKWWSENRNNYKSMDAAAEQAAGKIAPVAFRTARKWIGDHNKKQRAGTA
ncbi:hypothetical protein [Janthinobacterium sp. PAMC25594]|uniref:hypothetical protein n=1 Tax=Janthinobacterium sp. PAMC25594 TaxID=2861284 RepID=UPI001C62B317|nr:hypothetical protein [Janthinobacterium sp. PAMC25594]QYG05770.1 hypothetical protein KY494_21025 [Janthinobacterium sp. PAMC25594]